MPWYYEDDYETDFDYYEEDFPISPSDLPDEDFFGEETACEHMGENGTE